MRISESISSPSLVLPEQKTLDAAVFFYPSIQADPYELCGRITTQVAETRDKGFEAKYYFIVLDLSVKDDFVEAMSFQVELMSPESTEYIDGSDLKTLRQRMQEIFKNNCSYTVFSDDETESDCEKLKNNLPNFTFCGRTHTPLDEKSEKPLSALERDIESYI